MTLTLLLWLGAVLLIALGLAGLLFPALPGAPLLFAGLVLAAWADDFTYVGWGTLSVLGVLALLTYLADFVASAFGARRFGASLRAVTGAIIGSVVGLFFGLLGGIARAFHRRGHRRAFHPAPPWCGGTGRDRCDRRAGVGHRGQADTGLGHARCIFHRPLDVTLRMVPVRGIEPLTY